MTSLRMRVVEAGARAMYETRPRSGWGWDQLSVEYKARQLHEAEAGLDAMLDCLTESIREWDHATHVSCAARRFEGGPMTTRYYEERECEHGKVDPHRHPELPLGVMCPGGQRRELTFDYEAWADRVAHWLWEEHNESVHIGYLADAMERFSDAAIIPLEEPADG